MAGMRERPSMFINNGSIRFTVDKASFLKRLCTKHSFNNPVQRKGLVRYEDIEQLDSNFLITYIDSTFSAIRRRPWLKNLLFGQLCEYVLPYRVGHERPQQLFRLQDSIFNTDIADLLHYDDIGNEVATGIGLSQIFNGRIPREAKVLYRGNLINYNLTGCVSLAMLRSWLARLTLCPVALDLNPAFPTRNDRHCWSVMIDNRQMNSIQQLAFEVNKQGKIYRQTLPVILLRTPVKANTFLLFSEVLFTGT